MVVLRHPKADYRADDSELVLGDKKLLGVPAFVLEGAGQNLDVSATAGFAVDVSVNSVIVDHFLFPLNFP